MLKLKLQYFASKDAKSRLIGKDPDAGKDLGQEGRGATEDERVGWHHGLDGRGSEQTLGDSGGQRAGPAAVHQVAKGWTWSSD